MRLATLFGTFLPLWATHLLSFLFSLLAFLLLKKRRHQLANNLSIITGSSPSSGLVFQTFQNFGRSIAHLLQSPTLVEKILPHCEFQCESLKSAQAQGGAILVTAHFGNWELGGILLRRVGFPLSVIVEPLQKSLYDTYNSYRRRFGVEAIPSNQPKEMIKALKRKRILVFLADRTLSGQGVEIPFFGKKRVFPKGPAYFSLKYKLPIIPGYVLINLLRPNKRIYLLKTEEKINFSPSGDFEKDVITLTEIIAKRIEGWVRNYPTQWFVFDPEWQG